MKSKKKGQVLYEENTKYFRICFAYFNSSFGNNIYFNVLHRGKSNEYYFFTIITIAQMIHYKKTKIKYIGIRILITLIATIICWVIIYNGYGIFKNIQIKGYINTIDKIQFGNNEIDREYLKNNTRFVKDNFIITKANSENKIYYNDGRIEKTIMEFPSIGLGIININGNKCYINIDLVVNVF